MMQTFWEEAIQESRRACEKFPNQEQSVSLTGWLSIVAEELGEVARELNDDLLEPQDPVELAKRIRGELVQTAAMCERMAFAARLQLTTDVGRTK